MNEIHTETNEENAQRTRSNYTEESTDCLLYTSSITIPMMVTKEGLTEFMLRNLFMAFDVR